MAARPEDVEAALIDTVCSHARENGIAETVDEAEAFIRRYYHWVPQEDLARRASEDLSGAALAHFELMRSRPAGVTKVRVYNPEPHADRWRSRSTVIDVVIDDMPFLVDSIYMELSRLQHRIDLLIHPVMRVRRNAHGDLLELLSLDADEGGVESVIHAEVERETDPERLDALEHNLRRVLDDVGAAVGDWQTMKRRVHDAIDELAASPPPSGVDEAIAFLEWLVDDRFILLGYREYTLAREDGEDHLHAAVGSGLGILRGAAPTSASFARLPARIRATARTPRALTLTKGDSRSTVHQARYLDYVGVKRFDAAGEVVGERRFLGLYASSAEKADPRTIPVVRGKVDAVLRRSAFPPASHDAKALEDIIEAYPREELFQIEEDELFDAAMRILAIGERQLLRLLVRRDFYGRFVSCLVFVPRDRFNTANRERIAGLLSEAFAATSLDWNLQLSESALVRLHFILHLGPERPDVDVPELERRLAEATRSWTDDLRDALLEAHGEELGRSLFRRYRSAFPSAYSADHRVSQALDDIARAERVADCGRMDMRLIRAPDGPVGELRCTIYSPGNAVLLSDVLPIFENMSTRVVDERPYEVAPSGGRPVWIYDFHLTCVQEGDFDSEAFKDAFIGVWNGRFENDRLGSLVVRAGVTAREISVLRALFKYLRQAGANFSDRYMQQALTENPAIASGLVELFYARFDPRGRDGAAEQRIADEVGRAIDAVESLDHDRILRNYLALVRATVRTNYFRPDRDYLSFKLDPDQLAFLPYPRPRFEIFVQSPRLEGVHLRGGRVARGGIRWSDRLEDFRVEILGLMKAQTVKNAPIVPVGAKGGFVAKRPPREGGRKALVAEATACYERFIRGLLDLTDNIVGGEVVAPEDVVRYDDDDPYLVVAADKGTAALSDLANEIAAEYRFWLGDAFASGGSNGYDHKRMGITARTAWESVKRHFRELGVVTQTTDFTVVGIGDMSGDVFGNGMLLSPHIRLLAAFNHEHIFIDPNPDPEASFAERRRLFELPSSRWDDYDRSAISTGGGVYARAAKRVELSREARAALDVDSDALSPDELVSAILRAPADLLWNGGVGTYVKASGEADPDVGDKANDAVRVTADELRCRVVGEGGNLGLTQRARIQYALGGGHLNTDSIDNVGGVATSDDEVNLKILLDAAVAEGELTSSERNRLLHELAGFVAGLVIEQSYDATLALSLERVRSRELLDLHGQLIDHLEQAGELDRAREFLPSRDEIAERKRAGAGLASPELSVLSAYCKIGLHAALLDSDITEDEFLADRIAEALPPPLPERFREQMRQHRLRGDIIATQLANQIVDRGGLTFAFRIAEENDAPASDIARAYAIAVTAFDVLGFWTDVQALDGRVDVATQYGMLLDGRRLLGRATRWLVSDASRPIVIGASIARITPAVEVIARSLPGLLDPSAREGWETRVEELSSADVPRELAVRAAGMRATFFALDVAAIAAATKSSLESAASAYFGLANRLNLQWLGERILELPRPDLVRTLARAGLRDDLYAIHRELTADFVRAGTPDGWLERRPAALESYELMLADIRRAGVYDVTTLSVALRALGKLLPHAAAETT